MVKADLGLWGSDDLTAAISGYAGSGYNQDVENFSQFCHATAKIIRKRFVSSPSTLASAPSLYLMSQLPDVDESLRGTRCSMFDCGNNEVAGFAWFGSHRLVQATPFQLPSCDTEEIIAFVEETLSSGETPAIFYGGMLDGTVMRVYPRGLSYAEDCFDVGIQAVWFTADHLKKLIDDTHNKILMTPTTSGLAKKLWLNQQKAHPVESIEREVQNALFAGLVGRVGALKIEEEGTSAHGRFDLKFIEVDPMTPNIVTYHAILELKVVKSYTSNGGKVAANENEKAVSEGVKQAFAYRKDHNCKFSALCCFDLRNPPDPESALKHEQKNAEELEVLMWAWPIYSTAARARAALAQSKLSAG